MIRTFVFTEGKPAASDLDLDALKIVIADKGLYTWVDLEDPTDEEVSQILESFFEFHPLAIEDCLSVSHLPKFDEYESYFFMVYHSVDYSRRTKFQTTELNFFVGLNFVVTIHRRRIPPITAMRERCAAKTIPSLVKSPERLTHTMLDQLTDGYKPVMDELFEELDDIEDMILGENHEDMIPRIIEARKDLANLRRFLRSQQSLIHGLARGEVSLVRGKALPYYRDLEDKLRRIDDVVASHTDHLLMSFELYLNKTAAQTNEGIKVLTALTAVTLPPVIVGGWYGMNFSNMPELQHPLAYPIIIAVTFVGMIAMIFWLKSKKWF